MRLHQLTISAFGPFGAPQRIDFDALTAAGLYLLHGQTGAGKTSVLDAVCYALYGAVPGARQGNALRSDHAPTGTVTEVVLELTAGGRRLEITRRPAQDRPKKRGDGVTQEKAVTLLREHRPGEGWQGISKSHQEIGEEIGQLLGMSREQFCQVVLLPQGDFARFLRSDAEARGKLLGRLFDTRRFAAVEERLTHLKRAAENQVREGDERLLALAQRMRQAAGTGAREWPQVDARPGDPGLAGAVLTWAALARAEARERQDSAALALTAAEERLAAARRLLDEQRDLHRLQLRHAETRRRADELTARRPEHDRLHARLERAHKAALVAPALALRADVEREHTDALAARDRARGRLPDALADAGADRLAALERQLRQELGALEAARRAERRAADIRAERERLDRQQRDDDELRQEAETWLDGWDDTSRRLERRIEDARSAVLRAEALSGELEPARDRLEAARRRDELELRLADTGVLLDEARELANTAHERWLDLKERRLRGVAAELAAELAPGRPCAVCGAVEHPAPARPGAGHVDRATEEAAYAEYRHAGARRERTEGDLAALREECATARAESGGAPTAELAARADRLRREHTEARAAAADAHPAAEALDRARSEHAARIDTRQRAEQRIAACLSRREALDNELAAIKDQLRNALAGDRHDTGTGTDAPTAADPNGAADSGRTPDMVRAAGQDHSDPGPVAGRDPRPAASRWGARSIAEHAALLERRAGFLGDAAEAARAVDIAVLRLKEADGRLATAAHDAGFPSPEAAAAAVVPPAEQTAIERRLDAWDAEEAAVADRLAEPDTRAAAAQPPADPQAAVAAGEHAERTARDAASALAAARERTADLGRLSREAATEALRLGPLRAEYERVGRLAGLAAGTSADNEKKMRLESYVLAARLEQVAAAATLRLHRMSGGRYTLVHSDDRAGRGRSGLGLHVVDAWTGRERDTATLSGGETFFASLALALGLADVVTDEAGGMRLDTLFIDEGFGSLDEQTLDEVLDVLDSLRERDRSVGIVSHVGDLRRRIPAQLEVVKGRHGSAVRHRTAEGVSG
ncbi:AAA family ATPase [Streptomyces sp. NPDC060194]|uniref:AAA family ATPase n=1 Tax=Streptomyces sp. NPDC060194 TaxID=3347069 RepID=UPI003659473E